MFQGFTIDYPDPRRQPKALREQYQAAKLFAGTQLFLEWWSNTLPGHFRAGAESKYEYRQRNRQYMERKFKSKGHQDPLVFTGRARDKMLRQFPKPVILKHEMRLRFTGIHKGFYVKDTRVLLEDGTIGIGRPQPPKAEEATRVTKGEARRMGAQFKRDIAAKIKELRGA